MEALGLVLIDESFRALRDMLRGARAGKLDPEHGSSRSSVDILTVASPSERREHWRFIGRERNSGVTRAALRDPHRDPADHLRAGDRPGALPRPQRLERPRTSTCSPACSSTAMILIAEALEDAADAATVRGDPPHRRQAAADDHRRRRRLAQQLTYGHGVHWK